MYDNRSSNHCPHCEDEELVQLEGEWFCPECDNLAEFELTPDREEFIV